MLKRLTPLLAIIFFLTPKATAQDFVLEGVVSDKELDGIEYVNVSVNSSREGTYTASDGRFSITVELGDTLHFSHVGFQKASKVVTTKEKLYIQLSPRSVDLDQIVITPEKSRRKYSKSFGLLGKWWKYRRNAHTAIRKGYTEVFYIDNKSKARGGIIEGFTFKVQPRCKVKAALRVYRVGLDGRPGESLLDRNIILEASGPRIKWKDLEEYDIPFPSSGLFIGFELLEVIKNNNTKNDFISGKNYIRVVGTLDYEKARSWSKVGNRGWIQDTRLSSTTGKPTNPFVRLKVAFY